MPAKLTLPTLTAAVSGSAAAFRSVTQLQPVGGEGDKVFPATYKDGVYAKEKRRIKLPVPNADPVATEVDCVLLDSVQSQANRAEEALKHATRSGKISLPLVEVDFSDANAGLRSPIENLTSLDVPHRLADAILRDSLADGVRFSKSAYADRWGRSTPWNATAVYELCPTALVFGMWGSPLKPGGLGAKFERAYVSEIVAVDILTADPRRGFRVDPLGANAKVALKAKPDGSFELNASGKLKPSELNHGNIIFDSPNSGVRCRYAEQTTVVSLGALRKLRFPADGATAPARDNAARAVLAAIALCAGVLASEAGTSLRSRCHLWPVETRKWELLDQPGATPAQFEISSADAIALLNEAISAATQAGVTWNTATIKLIPSPELVALVKKSQELAAQETSEEEAAEGATA